MFTEKDFAEMPFDMINGVTFHGLSIIMYFKSGNKLEATSPNIEMLEQFKKECCNRLKPEQIMIISEDVT